MIRASARRISVSEVAVVASKHRDLRFRSPAIETKRETCRFSSAVELRPWFHRGTAEIGRRAGDTKKALVCERLLTRAPPPSGTNDREVPGAVLEADQG